MKKFFEIAWIMLSILWTPVDPEGGCIEAPKHKCPECGNVFGDYTSSGIEDCGPK